MADKDTITITLTREDAKTLRAILHAVGKTFRRDTGMNTGSSRVYNLYPSDIDLCFKLSDEINAM